MVNVPFINEFSKKKLLSLTMFIRPLFRDFSLSLAWTVTHMCHNIPNFFIYSDNSYSVVTQ